MPMPGRRASPGHPLGSPAPPVITSVTPNNCPRSSTGVALAIGGTGFLPAGTAFLHDGVHTVELQLIDYNYFDATSIEATIDLASDSAQVTYVYVTGATGESNHFSFTIT